jgi:hypothetical protein
VNPTIEQIVERVATFEREAHNLLAAFEAAPSRVISLAETRKQIGILNLKQTELLEEAVAAVEHGLYRPAIVMAWAAFMDFLQEKMTSDAFLKLQQVRPAWSKLTTLHELREGQTEFAILDAARDLKLLGKGEHKSLHGLLSKRNESAHPSGYKPGLNEALGYISELLNRIPTIGQRTL